MESIKIPAARNLRTELDYIASTELADVLASWPTLDQDQARRLRAYLIDEMGGCGMLSNEKAADAGQSLGRERAEGRRVVAAIEKGEPC